MIKWRLPERNHNFFIFEDMEHPSGRNFLLKEIHLQLKSQSYITLVGLSGTGKTSLAIEYAYRYIENYDEIYFLQGNDLLFQLKEIATELFLVNADKLNFLELVTLVIQSNQNIIKRLFILDDALLLEPINQFINYLFSLENTHLLLTSNNQHWENNINVTSLTQEESKRIFLKYFPQEDHTFIKRLIECLGGLPLAMIQAISYIKSASITIHDYLTLFESHPDKLLEKNTFDFWKYNYPYSAYKALLLTLEKLESKNENCLRLLEYCVFFYHENIPREIFIKILGSQLELNDLMITLLEYSLLAISEDKKYFSLHCLLHKILSLSLDKDIEKYLLKNLLRIIHENYFYSREKPHLFKEFFSYLIHLENFLLKGEKYLGGDKEFDKYYCLLNISIGLYQSFEKHNVEAANFYLNKGLLLKEENDITLLNKELGMLYNGFGHSIILNNKHQENKAEEYFQKSIQCNKETDIEITAYAYSGLSLIEFNKKNIDQAFHYGIKALALIETEYGEKHIDIPHFQYRLAMMYYHIDQHTEAKTLCLSAINLGKILSTDELNFDAAGAAFILGKILEISNNQQEKNEALNYYKYSYDVFKKLVGQDNHPEIIEIKKQLDNLQQNLFKRTTGKVIIKVNNSIVELSKKEADCLVLIKKGYSSKKIAESLYLSPRTIETHVEHIKEKFNCKTKLELIALLSLTEIVLT